MRRVAERRRGGAGLLTRRPQTDHPDPTGSHGAGINQADQLRRIVDLYDRGLVSGEELRRQQERALASE